LGVFGEQDFQSPPELGDERGLNELKRRQTVLVCTHELKVGRGAGGEGFYPKLGTRIYIFAPSPPIFGSRVHTSNQIGKGRTQKQAVEELVQFSQGNSRWNQLLEILASWRRNIELKDNVNDEDRELIMNLSPAYLKQREEWRQEGIQEGRQEGIQAGRQEGIQEGIQEGRQEGLQEGEKKLLLRLLRRRFGEITPDLEQKIASLSIPQLEALADAQLDFSSLDDLITWLSAHS